MNTPHAPHAAATLPSPWPGAWRVSSPRPAQTAGRMAWHGLARFGTRPWSASSWGLGGPPKAEPSLGDAIAEQREALFRWALLRSGEALPRREFASQAVAVLRQEGEAAFTDWLLWAAVLVARRAAEQAAPAAGRTGQGGPRHRLSPELRVLLRLAAAGQLSSAEVLALRRMPLDQARQALSAAQQARLMPASL